jgi:hypothetical protein
MTQDEKDMKVIEICNKIEELKRQKAALQKEPMDPVICIGSHAHYDPNSNMDGTTDVYCGKLAGFIRDGGGINKINEVVEFANLVLRHIVQAQGVPQCGSCLKMWCKTRGALGQDLYCSNWRKEA